jgi:hypothetical protein
MNGTAPRWYKSPPANLAQTLAAVLLFALFFYLVVLVVAQRGSGLSSVSALATALLGAITNPSTKFDAWLESRINVWWTLVAAGSVSTVVAAIFLYPAGYGAAGGAFVTAGAGLAGLLVDTSTVAAALRAISGGQPHEAATENGPLPPSNGTKQNDEAELSS